MSDCTRFNPLDHPICFAEPARLAASAWLRHVPLGMLLVDLARPKVLVELGTHFGVSYCAFCQAVRELGTDTRCHAVDTWEGDSQAGWYGPEVLADLRGHHDPLYGDFSRLIQGRFDDALCGFPDGSIDLLHIDGCHTYDVVRHDFERWLPKLSPRGVVVFHDIACREEGFGVWRLWEELREGAGSFEVDYGYGLGVLGVGSEVPAGVARLFGARGEELDRLRSFLQCLGSRVESQYLERSASAPAGAHTTHAVALEREHRESQATTQRLQLAAARELVRTHVPAGGTVIFAGARNDLPPAALEGRDVWPLSCEREDSLATRPEHGVSAIAHLEELRRRGAGWLMVPPAALEWLGRCDGFRQHLEDHYRTVRQDESGALFDLRRLASARLTVGDSTGRAGAGDTRPPGESSPDGRLRVHIMREQLGSRPHSSTYIRLLLPLQHPRNARRLEVTSGDGYRRADVVIVERTWTHDSAAAARLVETARRDGAGLMYSIDDNLLDLPAGHWVTPDYHAVVRLLAREADAVLVSTAALRLRMAEFNDRVLHVPNALDERLWSERADASPPGDARPGRLVVGYMGTSTHDADLRMIAEALRRALRRHGGRVELQLVGVVADPATLGEFDGLPVNVLQSGDRLEYPAFVRWMVRNVWWDLAVSPLRDDAFSRCKSDIKFLDYGALGIPGVYSRVPAYEHTVEHGRTGLLAENTTDAWAAALERLLGDDQLRMAVATNARRHVLAERTLRARAGDWHDAIRAALERAPDRNAFGRKLVAKPHPNVQPAGNPVRGTEAEARQDLAGVSALVLVPGGVNHMYDAAGRRIAEALTHCGATAAVHSLRSAPVGEFDCCFMVNPYELGVGYGDAEPAVRRMKEIRARAARAFAVSLDCAGTPWFAQAADLCRRTGSDGLLDLGLHDQSADVAAEARDLYRFVFNGLTDEERRRARGLPPAAPGDRPLPWVFVGHASGDRAGLVSRLVREADPAGVVYLPRLAPYTEHGPHLNDAQIRALLSRARCQVWCSHHDFFYMEGERFRDSLLAGCVPVKIVRRPIPGDAAVPFRDRLVPEAETPTALASLALAGGFARAWAGFLEEFCSLPSLEQGLVQLLGDVSRAKAVRAEPAWERSPAPAPAAAAAGGGR